MGFLMLLARNPHNSEAEIQTPGLSIVSCKPLPHPADIPCKVSLGLKPFTLSPKLLNS